MTILQLLTFITLILTIPMMYVLYEALYYSYWIKKHGGKYTYNLISRHGLFCFTEIAIEEEDIADDELILLKHFNYLEVLRFRNSSINGKFLSFIKNPEFVDVLDVGFTNLNDDNFESINKFKNIRYLFINNTKLSDKSVSSIKNLVHLEYLIIGNDIFSPDARQEIRYIKSLVKLY